LCTEFPLSHFATLPERLQVGVLISCSRFLASLLILISRDQENDGNKTVFVDALDDVQNNGICLVKLLIIIALRFGHVRSKSLEELLYETSQTPDGVIRWTRPDWPVVCAMELQSTLPVAKPLSSALVNYHLRAMCFDSGILGRITSHAIRRGASRELAHLPTGSIKGVADAGVAASIFHTNKSMNANVTAAYVGDLQNTHYNARSKSDFVDRLAPQVSTQPGEKKRSNRRSSAAIDAYITRTVKGDIHDTKTRHRVAHVLKRQEQQTVSSGKSGLSVAPSGPSVLTTVPNRPPLVDRSVNIQRPKVVTPSVVVTPPSTHEFIDPELLALGVPELTLDEQAALEVVENILFDPNQQDDYEDVSFALQEALDDDLLVSQRITGANTAPPSVHYIYSPYNEFVDYFTRINIRTGRGKADRVELLNVENPQCLEHGNSRDPPSLLEYVCGIGDCLYSTTSNPQALARHRITCTGTVKKPVPEQRAFPCHAPVYSKSYTTDRVLR
jgi:hypothetical protein